MILVPMLALLCPSPAEHAAGLALPPGGGRVGRWRAALVELAGRTRLSACPSFTASAARRPGDPGAPPPPRPRRPAAQLQGQDLRALAPSFAFARHGESGAVHVHDLHATILRLFGIDHERLTYRFQGRNFRLTDVHGKVVEKILA